MTAALYPAGYYPADYSGEAYEAGVASPFALLLEDPRAERVFFAHVTARDLAGDSTETIRLATRPYVSEPGDTPANTYWEPRLEDPAFRFSRQINDLGRFQGRVQAQRNDLRVVNADGGLDAYFGGDYAIEGWPVEILMGRPTFAPTDFGTIFKGLAGSIDWTRERIRVGLLDRSGRLAQPALTETFAGTGELEGGADQKGKLKPVSIGVVRNAAPVLVDAGRHIYQVSTREINALTAVRDQGAAISAGGTSTDIWNDSPGASEYLFQNTSDGAYFKLGSAPQGVVTFDAEGDAGGSGYVEYPGEVVRRILGWLGGLTDPDDFDLPSLSAVDTAAPYPCGVYVTGSDTVDAVVSEVVNSIFGVWFTRRDGRYAVKLIQVPGSPADSYDTTNTDYALERVASDPPVRTVTVNYRRNWRVMSAQELVGIVSDDDKATWQLPSRSVTVDDVAIAADWPSAGTLTIDSVLDQEADAEAVRDRAAECLSTPRSLYRVPVALLPFSRELMDSVEIVGPRYGLSGGKNVRIFGLDESAGNSLAEVLAWG